MAKPKHKQVDFRGLEIVADEFTGTVTPAPVTGAQVLLTGMTAGTVEAVAATDTVNQAIAKLQAQIDAI